MHKHDHSKNQVKAIANTLSGPTGINAVTAVDNRPEALRQSNLQEMANEGVKKKPAPQPPPVNNGNASAVVQPVLIYKGKSFSSIDEINLDTEAKNIYDQYVTAHQSNESILEKLIDQNNRYDLEKDDLPLIQDRDAASAGGGATGDDPPASPPPNRTSGGSKYNNRQRIGTKVTPTTPTEPTLTGMGTCIRMRDYEGSILIYRMIDPCKGKNEIHVHTNGTGGHGWTTIKDNGERGNGIVVTNDAQYQSLIQAILAKHPNVQ